MKSQIKDFALGIYDGPHATPKESNDGAIFLGIKNVTPEGRLDFSTIRYVSKEEFPKWTNRVTPQNGDVVLSYEATLHRYALIPEGFRGCLGRRMALVRPDQNKLHPRFLHYYFLSPKWRQVIDSNIIIGATVNRVPIKNLPNFEVDFPQLSEQKKIASILSAYDDLIENNRRRIQLLEESARLLYKEWFVHLRFPGNEHSKIIDGVPGEWAHRTVAHFGEIVTGKTPSTKNTANYGKDIPFIKTPDMHSSSIIIETEQQLSEEGANTQKKKTLPPHSILMACIGAKLGVVSLNAVTAQTNQQINAIIPKHDYLISFCFFTMKKMRPNLLAISASSTMPNVNKTKFKSLPVLFPQMSLIKEFHSIVVSNLEQITNLTTQNQKLAQARDLLLPRLMNGEIEV